MLKRWFSLQEEVTPANGTFPNGSANHKAPVPEPSTEVNSAQEERMRPQNGTGAPPVNNKYLSFSQIYQGSTVKPPRLPDGILKVADMVSSPHLCGMSPDAKRCSLLMALDAAGVEIEELLQDAVVRQRALNDYEEAQRSRLRAFEAAKADENSKIQAELDRLTSQYMSRIQANLDDIAREQDTFDDWLKHKQEESQRIAEAAAFCVPQGASASGSGLSMVLERATVVRR
jgi:hypothetical protein